MEAAASQSAIIDVNDFASQVEDLDDGLRLDDDDITPGQPGPGPHKTTRESQDSSASQDLSGAQTLPPSLSHVMGAIADSEEPESIATSTFRLEIPAARADPTAETQEF